MTDPSISEQPLGLPWLESLSEDWISEPRSSSTNDIEIEPVLYRQEQHFVTKPASRSREFLSTIQRQDLEKCRDSHIADLKSSNAYGTRSRAAPGDERKPLNKRVYQSSAGRSSKHHGRARSTTRSSTPATLGGSVRHRRCYSSSPDRSWFASQNFPGRTQSLQKEGRGLLSFNGPVGHSKLDHLFSPLELSSSAPQLSMLSSERESVPSSPPWPGRSTPLFNPSENPGHANQSSLNQCLSGVTALLSDQRSDLSTLHKVVEAPLGQSFTLDQDIRSSSSRTCVLSFEDSSSHKSAMSSGNLSESAELSPVYVSKQSTVDGHVRYSALDVCREAAEPSTKGIAKEHNSYREKTDDEHAIFGDLSLVKAEIEQAIQLPAHPSHTWMGTKSGKRDLQSNEDKRPGAMLQGSDPRDSNQALNSSPLSQCEPSDVSTEQITEPTILAAEGPPMITPFISPGSVDDSPTDTRVDTTVEAPDNWLEGVSKISSTGDARTIPTSLIGKKRKDARYEPDRGLCNPEYLSNRQILRPRNYTQSKSHRKAVNDNTECNTSITRTMCSAHQHVSNQASLGNVNLRVEQPRGDLCESSVHQAKNWQRKPSVSTQDYLNEALKIMDIIRSRNHPGDEAEEYVGYKLHSDEIMQRDCYDLTPQSIRRPPSREGGHAWKIRGPDKLESSILDHLQQYREKDDVSVYEVPIENSSLLANESHLESRTSLRSQDIPNGHDFQFGSTDGNPPSEAPVGAMTTKKAISTLHRPYKVTTIRPQQMADLMGSGYGNMKFDNSLQKWVKRFDGLRSKLANTLEYTASSEDNSLCEISDLMVDSVQEALRLRPCLKTVLDGSQFLRPSLEALNADSTIGTHYEAWVSPPDRISAISIEANHRTNSSKPETGSDTIDSTQIERGEQNSVSKESTQYEETQHGFKTHYSEADLLFSPALSTTGKFGKYANFNRANPSSVKSENCLDLHIEASHLSDEREVNHHSVTQPHNPAKLDDRRAISFIHKNSDGRTLSLSFSISTPVQPKRLSKTCSFVETASIGPGKIFSSLTPLQGPHFELSTLIQHRASRVRNTGPALGKEVRRLSPSTAVDKLVVQLSEAEPDEPYWDWLKKLCLKDSHLETLYMLDDFCPRIEDLDVSQNRLRFLEGLPKSIMQLHAQKNLLGKLTSWNHLSALQYLDISDNELESLESLESLVNLRDLCADRNRISTIEGIFSLGGLLKLSLAGNVITEVNFSGCGLTRLNSLCLANNGLHSISGLQSLSGIACIDLQGNNLKTLELNLKQTPSRSSLRTIHVDNNDLKSLDISDMPSLETLTADYNSIVEIKGVRMHLGLHTLSLRCQSTLQARASISDMLRDLCELKNIYISGNIVTTLTLQEPFLNLHNLEMSHTGLRALQPNFSLMVPNIRDLDVSGNLVEDIRPLRGLKKLTRLNLNGNRLRRLRRSVMTVGYLPQLENLDFRSNLFTAGFHSPYIPGAPNPNARVKAYSESAGNGHFEGNQTAGNVDTSSFSEAGECILLRRKIYELSLASQCRKLKVLDGQEYDSRRTLKKDTAWARLTELGVIVESMGIQRRKAGM